MSLSQRQIWILDTVIFFFRATEKSTSEEEEAKERLFSLPTLQPSIMFIYATDP